MLSALRTPIRPLFDLAAIVRQYRHLTWTLTKREIRDRYAGQFLGTLWAIGHPLMLMVIYVYVFAYVFKIKLGDAAGSSLDYSTYILSGLIPWLAFCEAMSKGVSTLITNANLVKQVVFPIDVLPFKGTLASLCTQGIATLLLIGYVLFTHGALPWTYALLPILWTAQFLAMLGLAYLLAAVGTYFRDMKDFVQVFCIANLYMMPLFYVPNWMPKDLQPVIYLNPFSYFAWCYQDACYFGRFEHPWSWVIFLVGSVALASFGYRAFRKLKPYYATVL